VYLLRHFALGRVFNDLQQKGVGELPDRDVNAQLLAVGQAGRKPLPVNDPELLRRIWMRSPSVIVSLVLTFFKQQHL